MKGQKMHETISNAIPDPNAGAQARRALVRGTMLHWSHWLVVGCSLLLTFGAWYISDQQVKEKNRLEFERQAEQAVDLVVERMQLYENALWGGVAFIDASDSVVTHASWNEYAESLHIERAYPGINGIGVIFNVTPAGLPTYLARERATRPEYSIHPEHNQSEFWPITYIEPEAPNRMAVGLDMAFETNRYTGIKKARDTGTAQVTGPITLVQDSKQTPGFLFYAPFYRDGAKPSNLDGRRSQIVGVTYAPFIMSKLMQGTLSSGNRQVQVKISDGPDLLYDDALSENDSQTSVDPTPLFSTVLEVEMYGRIWSFSIDSNTAFRTTYQSSQPLIILFGGIIIDIMLISLFFVLVRANRRALSYADDMTVELQHQSDLLAKSNQELEQFAYIASHDLKEPLRGMSNHARFLLEDYEGKLGSDGAKRLKRMTVLADKQERLIKDLLYYARLGRTEDARRVVDINLKIEDVRERLHELFAEQNVALTCDDNIPQIHCDATKAKIVLYNLILNGVKYNNSQVKKIHVGFLPQMQQGKIVHENVLYVQDNGIGIPKEFHEQVFRIFKRLHNEKEYGGGTGAGLTIVKKIIDLHGGSIWLQSSKGEGTTVYFTFGK